MTWCFLEKKSWCCDVFDILCRDVVLFTTNVEKWKKKKPIVWWYFKIKTEISIKNEKVFFAEKRILRERFKVALKEIGKENFFWKFFHLFRFFI